MMDREEVKDVAAQMIAGALVNVQRKIAASLQKREKTWSNSQKKVAFFIFFLIGLSCLGFVAAGLFSATSHDAIVLKNSIEPPPILPTGYPRADTTINEKLK